MSQKRILSHESKRQSIDEIRADLIAAGDTLKAAELVDLLDQVVASDMGRFVMENRGFNGYWTDYMIEYPREGAVTGQNRSGNPLHPMEKLMLGSFPTIRATQERADHFARIIQSHISEGVVMGSLPCGLMRDLLGRDYGGISQFELVGMDVDPESLAHAEALANSYGLQKHVSFVETDAWAMDFEARFDVLASNGLNIYVAEEQRVIDLYSGFYRALKTGGVLITSCVTPPPALDPDSEWDMDAVDSKAAAMQKKIFSEVIQAAWQHFRSSYQTQEQLQQAGFSQISVVFDKARLFPTFVAVK